MATLNLQVGASTDDAHAGSGANNAGRAFTTTGIDLTSVLLSPGSHGNNDEYTIGARFTNVTIAQAATINSASFILTPQSTYNAGASVVKYHVSAQLVADAVTFAGTVGNRLTTVDRVRTTAEAIWTQTSVTADVEQSISITSVIQEIINQGTWASGNDLVILVDTHTDCTQGEWQDYHSYDGSTTKAPKLTIDYGAAAATSLPLQPTYRKMLSILTR